MKDRLGIFLQHWRIKAVMPLLKGNVLDVGCGTNALCGEYSKRQPGYKAVGVDVHPWGGGVVIASSAHLPFADASFDTICCIAALNHIPEREEFLKEVTRVLTPAGRFIMTMLPTGISKAWHFVRKPWDADQRERGMKECEEYGFSGKQIAAMLDKSGLKLIDCQKFMLGINTIYIAGIKQ